MKQYFLEIVRQKWRLLTVVLSLLMLNISLGILVSSYQLPSLIDQQTKWSALRQKAARSGQMDATALHQLGSTDLEKLRASIPERSQFARILGDLLEAASSSAVEVGTINYKPVQIKEEALLSYQLSLSVSGSYAAVKSYLADLQKNSELIVVDSVNFSNSDILFENVVMDMHLTVYLREGA